MIVYHGGTSIIEHPIVAAGRERLDFGKGFYVTDIKSQAETWADRMQRIREEVRKSEALDCFEQYDNEWLQYIVANRLGNLDVAKYDVIEGGVANDRVIDVVEAYMANLMPLEIALRELSRHQPNNQICIANQKVIDECVSFVESYKL